jgi:phosphomannomutase
LAERRPAFPEKGNELASSRNGLFGYCRRLGGYFREQGGFDRIVSNNFLDGIRIVFSNNDAAHLRPSGNAPEFRMYAMADTSERSHEIEESCKRIVPHMIADVINQEPSAGFGPGGP